MNKIKYFKNKQRVSYAFIAKLSSLSPTYIYLLASDKRKNPSKEVMEKIAEVFGRTVQEIFYQKA